MSNKHNGWTNYETWIVNVWLSNEEPTHKYCVMLSKTYSDPIELANLLEEFALGFKPEIGTGMFDDMLNAALGEVNWREIAESYIEEYATPTESETK